MESKSFLGLVASGGYPEDKKVLCMKNLTEDQNQKMLFVLFRQAVYRSYYRFVFGTVVAIGLVCGITFEVGKFIADQHFLCFMWAVVFIGCFGALVGALAGCTYLSEILTGEGPAYDMYCEAQSFSFVRVHRARMNSKI